MEQLTFPPTYNDMIRQLPPGCRECPNALFNVISLLDTREYEGVLTVAQNIRDNCNGWRGPGSPQSSPLSEDGPLQFRKTQAINKHCPFDPSPPYKSSESPEI